MNLRLRAGIDDDLLVGVRCETPDLLDRARALFGARVDDHCGDIDWAYDVIAGGESHEGAPAAVPQLRHGTVLVARSRDGAWPLRALAAVLGGVEAQRGEPEAVWLALRVFVADDRAAIVVASRPDLVGDPRLARAGIVELPTWTVRLDTDGGEPYVVVPPPLTGLDWDAAGLQAPAGVGQTYRLDQIVVAHQPAGPGQILADVGARHTSPEWFRVAHAFLDAGRLHHLATPADLRRHLLATLPTPPTR